MSRAAQSKARTRFWTLDKRDGTGKWFTLLRADTETQMRLYVREYVVPEEVDDYRVTHHRVFVETRVQGHFIREYKATMEGRSPEGA